ncbi:MAG: sigma-70 family RNA polymerase sigma factor, partial [Cylindrospermopsis raciborskii KL1]|nr:sigma-70 family RNA polymerase sigma factor [Cylindrospermopsis raciborskii KL1]
MTPEEFSQILTQQGILRYVRVQKQILEKPKEGKSTERLRAIQEVQRARGDIKQILGSREMCRQLLTYTQQQNPSEQSKTIGAIMVMMDLSGAIYGKTLFPQYYEDALQINNIWFYENFVKSYNPDLSSIISWFNQYIKYKILDLIRRERPNVKSLDDLDDIPRDIPSPEPNDFIKKVEEMLDAVENCPN